MKKNLILLSLFLSACTTADTVRYESVTDFQNMDTTVKPGENFYRYANGKWLDSNPIPQDLNEYSQFEKVEFDNLDRQKEIIETLIKNSSDITTDGGKIAALYCGYNDMEKRNHDGCEPVKPYLEMINSAKDKAALTEVLGRLHKTGISDLLFFTGISIDIKDTEKYIVEISQGGLSLPDKDYYEKTDNVVEAYKTMITKFFTLAGYDGKTAEEKTKAVYDIEQKIAKTSRNRIQLRDAGENYNKITFSELKKDYNKLDWESYFKTYGFPALEVVNVEQPEVIHQIENLFENEKLENLKAYFEFKVLRTAANYLDENFDKANFELERVLWNTPEQEPLWKRAINAVNSNMGMAMSRLYAEKYFPETSKQAVITIVKNLQEAFRERIKNADWMSAETKNKAIEKLNAMRINIGYPEKWTDYSDLKIDKDKPLLDNILACKAFAKSYRIKNKVNKPVDKEEWSMPPHSINAYYKPTTNEITFPAGILQPPFYNAKADEAEQYGSIGCVIGHEMTHGFDDMGSKYDKYGNHNNWWTEDDKTEFQKRTGQVIEYFNTLEVLPGGFVNGELTLGENIADNGGIKIAFSALQNVMKQKKLETINGFTPEQRFFLAYAFVWADNIRENAVRFNLKYNPHTPMKMRVNGQMPQLDFWYNAFNITDKDPMYIEKDKRVEIW